MNQITLFEMDTTSLDYTTDRDGKKGKPPSWYNYKRCENCERWMRLDKSEQPPAGHGIIGYCMEWKAKCDKISFCGSWEDIRKVKE
ncbi:MAG: hypothetical protein KBT03_04630 [Bacteroidales bacterium]|nr:hypothetical protein [Candidatus Scybalousia scybalohippi]